MYASFNSIAFFYYRQFDVLVRSWFSHYDLKDIFFVYDLKDPAHFMITIQDIELFPEWMKIIDYYFTSCKRDDQLNIGCVHSCRQAGRLNRPTAWQKKNQNCIIRMAQVNWRWNLSLFLFHFYFLVVILCQFDQVTS